MAKKKTKKQKQKMDRLVPPAPVSMWPPNLLSAPFIGAVPSPREDYQRSLFDSRNFHGALREVVLEKRGVRLRLAVIKNSILGENLSVSLTLPPSAMHAIVAFAAEKKAGRQ